MSLITTLDYRLALDRGHLRLQRLRVVSNTGRGHWVNIDEVKMAESNQPLGELACRSVAIGHFTDCYQLVKYPAADGNGSEMALQRKYVTVENGRSESSWVTIPTVELDRAPE